MANRNDDRYLGVERRSPPAPVKPGIPDIAPADKAARRHRAITSKVSTWGNYRSWIEKARETWEDKK